VVRAIRKRQLRIELSVRGAKPALSDRRVRVERALEDDSLQVGREHADDQEQVGVAVSTRRELGRDGPVISVSPRAARVRNVTPSPRPP
jgi:hypothetical protein